MKVVSVISGLSKSSGGPPYSVARLCESVARCGVRQSLFAMTCGGEEIHPDAGWVETVRIPAVKVSALRLVWAPGFRRELEHHCRNINAQIIHSHGLWCSTNHAAAAVARKLGLPLVVSPHGMLSPWAFRHKAWKKRLAGWIYQNRDLRSAALFRATAAEEAEAIRGLGFKQPVVVIPNGVDLPPEDAGCQVPACMSGGSRTVLFMGRIYPVKGLRNLVAAWAAVRPAGWQCVIAGPDESGHRAEVEQAVKAAGLERDFIFTGPVDGEAKWSLLRHAGLLVLPSFTENFGVAVAEALAFRVPVITTKGTPWRCLEEAGCGWWVDIGPEALAAALAAATRMHPDELRQMGAKGRTLVTTRFDWAVLGKAMNACYEGVLARHSA